MLIKLIARTPLQKNYIFLFILIYFFYKKQINVKLVNNIITIKHIFF